MKIVWDVRKFSLKIVWKNAKKIETGMNNVAANLSLKWDIIFKFKNNEMNKIK